MKISIRVFFTIVLFASTILFATGVGEPTIVSEDKTNVEMLNTAEATDIVDLSATSTTGLHVCNFIIKSLPASESGILYMEDGVTAVKVNQNLTEDETNGLKFDPKEGFVGTASFTYSGMDVNGNEGSVATVSLPIIADNSESDNSSSADVSENNSSVEDENTDSSNVVVTDDKINPNMLNTLPAVDILNLSGRDANGVAVDNFIIKSLPNEESGVLYMADGTTTIIVEQNLTKDESDGLKFDPKERYVGDANFTYQAVDTNGELGNVATVTIPIVGRLTPDKNGSNEDCVCDDYNESIPVLNNSGLFFMILLTSLLGLLFTRKEII